VHCVSVAVLKSSTPQLLSEAERSKCVNLPAQPALLPREAFNTTDFFDSIDPKPTFQLRASVGAA
jgi:hypothetical protein